MEVRPGYKQTDVGVIPAEWDVVSMECAAEIIDPQPDHRTPPECMGGDPYIGISDFLDDGTVDWEASRKIIPKAVDKQHARFLIRGGDIIFGKIGTIGVPKFVPAPHVRYGLSANVLLLQPKVEPCFLLSWLRSDTFQRAVNAELHSTSQAAFGINKMRRMLVPAPCKLEQRAIATALGDMDALLGVLDRLIAKKRELKQATMQQLLSGKTRLPGVHGEWEVERLGEVGRCLRGVSYRGDDDLAAHDTVGTKRLLRANNVRDALVVTHDVQFVNAKRVAAHQILLKDDILVCMANGSKALVGKAGLFAGGGGHEYTFGAFMGCFRTEAKAAHPHFTFALFQTGKYRDYINNLLAGSSINNLRPASIESLQFRFPDLREQTAIAAVLFDMDAELSALEARRDKTRQLKLGMMQELLTGRTRLESLGAANA